MDHTYEVGEKIDNTLEVNNILEINRVKDLKKLLRRRDNFNQCNVYLIYFFHITQCIGILITTLAAGYDLKYLIWLGVSLNAFASLINVIEKTNNSISKKMYEDIDRIKKGIYLHQSIFVDPPNDTDEKKNKQSISQKLSTNV